MKESILTPKITHFTFKEPTGSRCGTRHTDSLIIGVVFLAAERSSLVCQQKL